MPTSLIRLECQECAQITEKPIDWLLQRLVDGNHPTPSLAPHETECGHTIDLTTPKNRRAIGKRSTIF